MVMRKTRVLAATVIHLLVVMLGTASLVFGALRLTGDPALMIAPPTATVDDLAAIRREFGLDRPVLVQYGDFLWKLAHGDLAESFRYRRPALEVVLDRFGATLQLALAAQGLAILVALPLGVLSAVPRNPWINGLCPAVAAAGQSIPHFWFGLMAIVLFGVHLGWLPTSGRGGFAHLVL